MEQVTYAVGMYELGTNSVTELTAPKDALFYQVIVVGDKAYAVFVARTEDENRQG